MPASRSVAAKKSAPSRLRSERHTTCTGPSTP
ncbi:Uncharacterised protein [Bordetella pertussis]|nr:Uncharacterised protein [Bordetella pertussis]CFV99584.1 Uncharacterised protein [Bordetella pertussis]